MSEKPLAGFVCEICGRPTTIEIRDVFIRNDYSGAYEEFFKYHHFCDEHKREPKLVETPLAPFLT